MNISRFNKFLNSPAKSLMPLSQHLFKFRRMDLGKEQLKKYKATQDLAIAGANEISSLIIPGMTELDAATLLDTYLRDHGVKAFVHYSFAWFGSRTRFDDCQRYKDLSPSKKIIKEGEIFILDTAPVLNGVPADVGLTFCLGENKDFKNAMIVLERIKRKIPSLFELNCASGEKIYKWVNDMIDKEGFDCIHQLYPFGVLAHRLYEVPLENFPGIFKPFSWQAYWSLLSRGFYSETISGNGNLSLEGLWAIEPHIGGDGYGAKFEEMLYLKNGKAVWLSKKTDLKE